MFELIDKFFDQIAELIVGPDTTKRFVTGVKGRVNLIFDENLVTQEEFNNRKLICSTCREFENETCQLCGCPIDYKAKLKESKGGTCPLKKW